MAVLRLPCNYFVKAVEELLLVAPFYRALAGLVVSFSRLVILALALPVRAGLPRLVGHSKVKAVWPRLEEIGVRKEGLKEDNMA